MRIFLLVFLVASAAWGYPEYPDASRTPGDLCTESDSDFQEYRYSEQIPYCRRSVSSGLKKTIYRDYGIDLSQKSQYTIDHLVPLSMGGSNSRENLWPEHKAIKALRPNLEYKVYLALRGGRIYQEEAVDIVLEAKFNPYDPIDPEWQRALEPDLPDQQDCE